MATTSATISAPSRPKDLPGWAYRAILHLNALDTVHHPDRSGDWAGFVLDTLLPRLGIERRETGKHLDLLKNRGIVRTEQVKNPKSPDRMTTIIHLNQDHPEVRQSLEHAAWVIANHRPIEISSGDGPVEMIRRDRDRGEVEVPIPRPSPTLDREARAIAWSVLFRQGSRLLKIDRSNDACLKAVEEILSDSHVGGFERVYHPGRTSLCSMHFHVPGSPTADFCTDELSAQWTEALYIANVRVLPMAQVARDTDRLWIAGIPRMGKLAWSLLRAFAPVGKGVTASLFLTVKGLCTITATTRTAGVAHPDLKTEQRQPVVDVFSTHVRSGLDVSTEALPETALDEALADLANHFNWSSPAGPN